MEAKSGQSYISPVYLALAYVALGQNQRAVEWLEEAYEERSPMMIGLRLDARFEGLRDPRFTALLQKVAPAKGNTYSQSR